MMPFIATTLAALYLPVPAIMLWLHLPHRLWKRWGARSYLLHAVVYAGMVATVIKMHEIWSRGAIPPHPAVSTTGGVLVLAALGLLALTYRHIDSLTAMAVPQLVTSTERRLITGGIYGVVRHPRYTVLIMGSLGNYLMSGTPALLAAFVITVTLTLVVVRVEEKELTEYFGDAYRRYAADVPGIIPRLYMKR